MFEDLNKAFMAAPLMQHATLAVFGALVHSLVAHREGKSKGFLDFIILVIISSFTGVMFSLVALHYFPNSEYLTMASAGTGGYIGVEGMALLVAIIKKKLIK